jgi:hypothetical protein
MNFRFLVKTIKGLILSTDEEWDNIYSENRSVAFFNLNLLLPLVLLVTISSFIGSLLFIDTGLSDFYSVLTGIRYFILFYITVFCTTYIFKGIAKLMKFSLDNSGSFKITVCTITPFLMCQIISLMFESFIFVNILAFYGLFIGWMGIKKILNPPQNRNNQLMLAEAAVILVLFFVGNRILAAIFDKIYYTYFAS